MYNQTTPDAVCLCELCEGVRQFRYAPLSALHDFWWSGWLMTPLDCHHGHYSWLAEWRCCCD